jgi:hypothetical protein
MLRIWSVQEPDGITTAIVALQLADRLHRQLDGKRPISGTPGRLTAAGLPLRHNDLGAGRFEQAQGGKADGRAHQVDQAGNVEGQAHANIAAHKKRSG